MERRSEPLLFSGRMLKENKRGRVSREELCEPWNKTKLQKSWEQEKQNETLSAEKIMLKGPISWGSWNIGVLREGSVLEEEGKKRGEDSPRKVQALQRDRRRRSALPLFSCTCASAQGEGHSVTAQWLTKKKSFHKEEKKTHTRLI